jgi:DNA-binding MarR family transcriptional regulator
MEWFKMQNGVSLDPRLWTVARRAGLKRGEMLALWAVLYDHASRNRPRGSLAGLDADDIAALTDMDAACISVALDTLYTRGMITTDNHIAEWTQVQRLSTDRVRAHRARCRDEHPA